MSNSQHTKGIAVDLWIPRTHRDKAYAAAKEAGFTAFGWGTRSVHFDRGSARWWTYNDQGDPQSGKAKYKYLHKAPANFKRDFGIDQ